MGELGALVATGGPGRDRRAWSRPEALNPEKFSPPANRKTEQPATDWFWLLGENFAKIWKTGQQPWSLVTVGGTRFEKIVH